MCFPVKIYEVFKNTYFEEHLRTIGSGALPVQAELWGLIDEIWRLHCALFRSSHRKLFGKINILRIKNNHRKLLII